MCVYCAIAYHYIYFCHDVRVIRLPRHGGSCPIGIGLSCSADRQIVGKITSEGVFLEQLEQDPAKYLPDSFESSSGTVVNVDLNRPISEVLQELTRYPCKTRFSLTGPLIVARDLVHAKIKEYIETGRALPDYMKDYVIYYAGPAKTPEGAASGSFGPTTSARMDSYVPLFQQHGLSRITLGKGNRSKQVVDSCRKYPPGNKRMLMT